MTKLKLLFFVNGVEGSAVGIRAEIFATRLPQDWKIEFCYRPRKKWQGLWSFVQSAIAFQPDIIYVMDTAYTGVLASILSQQLTGCKLITDTGDVAYELAQSKATYSKPQLALIRWVEQLAIHRSDRVVVRGSYHKQWLVEQGVPAHQIEFVPDGVEIDSLKTVAASSLRKELDLDNDLVVGLVGTMSWSERYQMCYGWDVVEALGLLKDEPVKGLLVGDGNGRKVLEKRVEELGISDRIVFTGQIPYEDLPCYLAAMDVCVSTQSNDLVGQVRTTGKLPLYLASGKYVVATDVGEASRVLPSVGCLLPYEGVKDNNHPARLANHLKLLIENPERVNVSKKARQIAKENFDYDLLAQRVKRLCQNLVSCPLDT